MIRKHLWVWLAAVLLGLTAAAAHADEKPPIKIGFSIEQTGGLAAVGKTGLLAFQIWADNVNKKGGLLGRQVKLIFYDDQSNPANVPGIYTKLLDIDKVDLVVSSYATNLVAPAMPIIMQKNRLFFGLFALAINVEFHYPKYFSMLVFGPDPKPTFSKGFFDLAMSQNPKPKTVALVTADAGFVGYEYWKALIASGRHLLIRVGANVRLLKNLGYIKEKNSLVYLWPDRQAARNQPPLVLRLVVAQGGKHPVYLVTSVLDEAVLWDQQVVAIYVLRWRVELFYRRFKQTFERRKLRSDSGDNAELEATWSLLGLWAMSLHTQVELAGEDIPPRRISVAKMLRAYRTPLRQYKSAPDPGESFRELVSRAVIDSYQRAKKNSRDYPRKKHGHAIGAPQILNATQDQINIAQRLRNQSSLGLTA